MKHLSSEQISSVVAGIAVSKEAHLRECASCASEVESARKLLLLFGNSVRSWTETLDHSEFPIQDATGPRAGVSDRVHRRPLAWALVAAALATAVAIPLYQDSRDREIRAQVERDEQLRDAQLRDEQLMVEVNAQLSRRNPMAMDALMKLMSVPDGVHGTDSKSHGNEANVTPSH